MMKAPTSETVSVYNSPGSIFKGEQKEYAISQWVTTLFFLLIAAGDAFFSLKNNLVSDTILITVVLAMGILTIMFLGNKKHRILNPPNIFFVSTAALFSMVVLNGYSTGSYFYYFPASVVYFLGTANRNNVKRFWYFIIITLVYLMALTINYAVSDPRQTFLLVNETMTFRFVSSIVLSALLVKNIFALQAYLLLTEGRKEFHEALFQSYLDAYVIYNCETREVVDYNKRMIGLFEIPAETELKNLYITQVMMRYLAEDSPNKDLMMDNVPDYWHGEAAFTTHKKTKFFSYVKSVVYFRDEIKFQILSIRDITHTKQAEQELMIYKESVEKAGRAKARFLSSMSHELRTPLNGIIGTSNLIKAEPNLTEDLQKHIDVLLYSSEHMLGIINDILDFSKIDAGKTDLKKQGFNVKQCIDNVAASFQYQFKHKEINLVIDQSPELDQVSILSDEVKLSQVLTNLLSNALKFTLQGSVTLGVHLVENQPDKITIAFEVKDTGIGIPPEKQLEIFQGFSQVHAAELSRRFGGTGLGLTISEKLVAIFGGKLEVESEMNQGSRFYFTLSFEPGKQVLRPLERAPREEAVDIRGIKILIVEDNEINAKILKSFLKKWEVQIKEAGNGVHALEILKYHRFDLILMDLEMPEMDGYTAIKILRTTDTTTPVLAFTASLLENMDEFLADAGFDGYVLKPYRPAELKEKIEAFAPHRRIEYT
ncbi:MAG: response regulator [Bacteroidota bacterium]